VERIQRCVKGGLEYPALLLAFLAALSMVAIVGIIVTSVILRKLFMMPLPFTEEVVGMLMSVSLFLALPLVTLRDDHIRVSILADYLKRRSPLFHTALMMVATTVGVIFCGWILWESWDWFQFAFNRNLRTETTRILLWPSMTALPISIFFTALILLARHVGWTDNVGPKHPDTEKLYSEDVGPGDTGPEARV
jgi:TRAP-type transport system small permease protein